MSSTSLAVGFSPSSSTAASVRSRPPVYGDVLFLKKKKSMIKDAGDVAPYRQLTPHQCLKKLTRRAEEKGKPLLPALANSHSKGGPASIRPSELYLHKHNSTFETKGIAQSDKVFTLPQNSNKEGYQEAHSVFKDLPRFPPYFYFCDVLHDLRRICNVCQSCQREATSTCNSIKKPKNALSLAAR